MWSVCCGSPIDGSTAMANDIHVHVTVKGFHPRNRYRVIDSGTVAELGWTNATGYWGVPEGDRQVCPVPIHERCACTVVQRDS